MNFTVLATHKVKIKKNEKLDEYLDYAKELKKKKLLNMKLILKQIVIPVLGTAPKCLGKGRAESEIRIQTIQITN